MDPDTTARLLELNKQFYQTFGKEFSSTRERIQPGVRRIVERLQGDESILDLGCGNGALGRELTRHGHSGFYLGLDSSLSLLTEAERPPSGSAVNFIQADLCSPDWENEVAREAERATQQSQTPFHIDHSIPSVSGPARNASLPEDGYFDIVIAFAVLHHIPGADHRKIILQKAHRLLRAGGQFIHSEWQFLNSEKLTARIQPWEAAGFSPEDLEAGDTLLDWRQGGRGLRYVHHFDEAELNALAAVCRFSVRETFHADGENGRLGLYQVWEKI